MTRGLITATVIAGLTAAAPASADAYLSKTRAQDESYDAAEAVFAGLEEMVDFGVDRASRCDRPSANAVECDAWWETYDDIVCEATIRVRRTASGHLRVTFPYDPECY